MFQVKICGITSIDDALAAAEAGADAIGLNFYHASPRCIDLETAREISSRVPAGVLCVGLFVNDDADRIRRTAEYVGVETLQLHGDEPPADLQALKDFRVIKAFRCPEGELPDVESYLSQCRDLGSSPVALLFDAHQPGQHGGTGTSFNWPLLHPFAGAIDGLPVILAGGLTPKNVAEAVAAARPSAVDTASGVERSPGKKDHGRIKAFVEAARLALSGRVVDQ